MKKQNKVTRVVAAGLACVLVMTSTPVEASAAAKPSWKSTKSTLTVGKSVKFKVKKPAGSSVAFSSSKKAVATVGKKTGLVKAKKAGKTVIKAVVKVKKKKYTLSKKLTVKNAVTEVPATAAPVVPTQAPAGGNGQAPAGPTQAPAGATTAPSAAPTNGMSAGGSTTAPATNTDAPSTTTALVTNTDAPAEATKEPTTDATQTPAEETEAPVQTEAPTVSQDPGDVIVSNTVKYKNITTVQVDFTAEIDDASVDNFKLVKAGAGQSGFAPASVKLSSDKKSVTLTFNEGDLEYATAYTVICDGLKANGKSVASSSVAFTSREKLADNSLMLELSFSKTELVANGKYNTECTIRVVNANTGALATDVNGISINISTSYGKFSNETVNISSGVAKTLLVSEFISATDASSITATVDKGSSYNDYASRFTNENVSTTVSYYFQNIVGDTLGEPILSKAESNVADRVTLIFDQPIDVSYFVRQYADGTYETEVVNGVKQHILKDPKVSFQVKQDINNDGQYSKDKVDGVPEMKKIVGFMPDKKNDCALQLILDESTPLHDNCAVEVSYVNGTYGINNEDCFVLTDARSPQLLDMEIPTLKKFTLTFSEAIPQKAYQADARFSMNSATGITDNEMEDWSCGVFDPEYLTDERNIITVTLGKETDETNSKFNLGDQIYFESEGQYSVQATKIRDYAGLTDKKANCENYVKDAQTQTKKAPKCDVTPEVSDVIVESPEQWRVKFNCPIRFKDATDNMAAAVDFFTLAFRYKDLTKGYLSLYEKQNGTIQKSDDHDIKFNQNNADGNKGNLIDPVLVEKLSAATVSTSGISAENEFLRVTDVSGDYTEFVVEMVQDWSVIYGYNVANSANKSNQHNTDTFEFEFSKGTFINDDNGYTNEAQEENLSKRNDELTYLGTLEYPNPKVTSLTAIKGDGTLFRATYNVPVQFNLTDEEVAGADSANMTHNTEMVENGKISVTIRGTNSKGNEEIITNARVLGYDGNDAKKTDTMLCVEAYHENKNDLQIKKTQTLQQLVDEEGWDQNFKIMISNVYDDSGRHSAESTNFNFVIEPSELDFQITQVAAVEGEEIGTEKYDCIYVTFTKGVEANDDSVSNVVNWILDGMKLSSDAKIENDVKGPGNAKVGYRRIRIRLAAGTLNGTSEDASAVGKKHVLNANQALVSKDGTVLTGENEWVFMVYETFADAIASDLNAYGK